MFSRFVPAVPRATTRVLATAPRRGAKMAVKRTLAGGYSLQEGMKIAQAYAVGNFNETLEIIMILGLDPRKPNQTIRGVSNLPHGTGKSVKVAVFAKGAKAEEAKAAGAHVVGADDLVEQIQGGNLDFTRCVATPDMMPLVARVARVLGPRGLMPNPKAGTVTMDVAAAVSSAQKGAVEFRNDRQGNIAAALGKASFPAEHLVENIGAFVEDVKDHKPSGAKGTLIRGCYISTSQGVPVKLDIKLPPFKK